MKLVLLRKTFTSKSTEGILYIDGVQECFTLEDTDRKLEDGTKEDKVYGKTCIPRGEYKLKLTESPTFGRVLPLLLDVPYFKGIRIHKGNKPENTEGCILVGAKNLKGDDNWISQSKIAFDSLFEKLKKASEDGEEITITID